MTMANMDREQLGELLSGYIDNELEHRERAFVERLIESDADVRQWYESLRKTVASVQTLPRHEAPASLSADLLEQLERRELLDGDLGEVRSTTVRFPWFGALSAAAVLVAVTLVGISQYPQWSSPNATPEKLALNVTPNRPEETRGVRRNAVDFSALDAMAEAPRRPVLDMAAKLTAGMDIEAIRTHDFSNETVRLTVALKDRRSQETALNRIMSHLASTRVVDATSPDAAHIELASSAFFVNGKVGVNFKDHGKREVLVRIPAAALDGLLDEVAVEAVNAERVTFAAGSLTYGGLGNARRILRPLGSVEAEKGGDGTRQTRIAARERRLEQPASEFKPPKDDMANEDLAVELFETLDIAPDVLARADKLRGRSAAKALYFDADVTPDVAKAKKERVESDRMASLDGDDVRTNKPMTITGASKAPRGLKGRSPTVAAAPADEGRDAKAAAPPAYFVTLVLEFAAPPPDKPTATPDALEPPPKTSRTPPPKRR